MPGSGRKPVVAVHNPRLAALEVIDLCYRPLQSERIRRRYMVWRTALIVVGGNVRDFLGKLSRLVDWISRHHRSVTKIRRLEHIHCLSKPSGGLVIDRQDILSLATTVLAVKRRVSG